MAAIISEALDALLEPRESTKAIDKLLGLVADLLAGKEPQHVKAWQDAQESFDGNGALHTSCYSSCSLARSRFRCLALDQPHHDPS